MLMCIFGGSLSAPTATHARENVGREHKDPQSAEPSRAKSTKNEIPNSVNLSLLGLVFGTYALNYERLFNGTHGLLIEMLYQERQSDEGETYYGAGGLLGYRFHWSHTQSSGFVGGHLSCKAHVGTGTVSTSLYPSDEETNAFEWAVTANVGRRWQLDFGLNITLRAGIGAVIAKTSRGDDARTDDAFDALGAVYDDLDIITFDGEVSVGWSF